MSARAAPLNGYLITHIIMVHVLLNDITRGMNSENVNIENCILVSHFQVIRRTNHMN